MFSVQLSIYYKLLRVQLYMNVQCSVDRVLKFLIMRQWDTSISYHARLGHKHKVWDPCIPLGDSAVQECSVYNSVFTTSESPALHECSVYNSVFTTSESPALHECSVYNSVFTTSESTALHECSVYNSVFTTSY